MGGNRFRLKPCALVAASISLAFAHASIWANPTGPQVISGQVNFQQPNASVLNVTNSPGAIINWQGFSIGASEVTRFVQQSAASSVLNRVTGGNVSQIYGQLLSNGRVFLINPGGIVVGPGAIVDTAGFVASTLNMLDSDFLNGKLRFQGDASSGSIINQGWIRTGYGGQVVLVAPTIENSGLIHTPGGELILAAGKSMTISTLDLGGVQFEVQAPTDSVVNVGKLLADGGAVGVFAGSLRNTGEIRANSLALDEAGRVVLKAQSDIQLAAGSVISVDGKVGGSVTVQSGGSTRVVGTLSATGSAGAGGSIQLLGDRVAVVGGASVDASGATRGGQILVGGDYQGANPAIQNSTDAFVGYGSTLRADATQNGDGGRIIVWSDDKAQFYGSLSARGGPGSGNGGFAEVSGKQGLIFEGSANLSAPSGSFGTLLLDPLDLFVFANGGIDKTIADNTNASGSTFPSNAATVSPSTLAAVSGNVTLLASRFMQITDPINLTTPGQGLTATVSTYTVPAAPDPLSLSNSVANRLDLRAGITTVGGLVTLNAPTIFNAIGSPLSIATSGGAINLNATNISGSNLTLNAGTGAVTTSGGSVSLTGIIGSSYTATQTSFLNPGTVSVTGPVSMTGSSISATVNGSSSLTATSSGNLNIFSATDVNVANVTSTASSVQIQTTGGSILRTGTGTVKGQNVTLQTTSAGGTIGTLGAGNELNVDVQNSFSFRPFGNFNIALTGAGPNVFTAQLPAAASGTYSGSVTKSGALAFNVSNADTSTVTFDLNVTSGFNTGFPSISISSLGTANLTATNVQVPAGNNFFDVSLSTGGNLTVNNYLRASGATGTTTSLNAGGSVLLGTVNAAADDVFVTTFGGPVNPLSDTSNANEILTTGTLSVTGNGIGTTPGSFPLDLQASRITLTSNSGGAIGGGSPVVANTTDLTVNAGNGSTFNVSTGVGGPLLTNLVVTANAGTVGTHTVTGDTDVYNFAVAGGNFSFASPNSLLTNLSFTATSGSIALTNPIAIGSSNLTLRSNFGAITTGGNSISAGAVTLNAGTNIDFGGPGSLTASTGNASATSGTTMNIAGVTAAGNVTLQAGGQLTLGGSSTITSGAGGIISISSGGASPFQFAKIDAGGASGTVSVTSAAGIEQTGFGPTDGITAGTVTLSATAGPIHHVNDIIPSPPLEIDLRNTTNLTVITGGAAKLDLNTSVLTNLSITKSVLPVTQPVTLTGLGGGQTVSIINGTTGGLETSVSSPTPLNFTLDTTGIAGTSITLPIGGGITTSGGGVTLRSGAGISFGGLSSGISSGAGTVILTANNGAISNASTITTTTGSVNLTAFGAGGSVSSGVITTGGGSINLTSNSSSVDVTGALTAGGTGAVTLNAGTSITDAGAFTVSSNSQVTARASNGDIGAGGAHLLITSPTVNLDAVQGTLGTGNVFATLTGTSSLDLVADNSFNVSSNTALTSLNVETLGTGTGGLSLTGTPGQAFTFARPTAGTFQVVAASSGTPLTSARFVANDGTLLVDGATTINATSLTLSSLGTLLLRGTAASPLALSNTTQTFEANTGLTISGKVSLNATNQTLRLNGSGAINLLAGGAGESVSVAATNSQNVCGFGCFSSIQTLNVLGGSGAGAFAELTSGGSQSILVSGPALNTGTTIKGGSADGAYALVQAGTSQSLSGGGRLQVESGTATNTSAKLIGGTFQQVFAGALTVTGNISDALITNASGNQTVNASTLIVNGGHTSTTAGIQNLGTGLQQVTSGGQLRVSNNLGGAAEIGSAGNQSIAAQFIEVLTGATAEAGANSSKIISGGTQKVVVNNASGTNPSVKVAALGTGDASVESTGSQLIELDYPAQLQVVGRDGRMIIGDVNAAGTSRVRSASNQTVFAKSITIQAGGVNSISELKAAGAQAISTMQGGISVLGGSGNDSKAQIDSTTQSIVSNGSILVQGGSGTNAVAQIIANTGTTPNGQTVVSTNGNILVSGGSAAGAAASISNDGSSSFVGAGSGSINMSPGTVAGADAIISVGNGPGTLTAFCLGSASCADSLPAAGASPTGGIRANGRGIPGPSPSPSPSPSPADSVVASATTPILTAEDYIDAVLAEITPESTGLERRAPGCN